MDLLTSICETDSAAGNAGDPTTEKRQNKVELDSKKLSQHHEHQFHDSIVAADAEHWMTCLVLLVQMPLLPQKLCIAVAIRAAERDSPLSLLLVPPATHLEPHMVSAVGPDLRLGAMF